MDVPFRAWHSRQMRRRRPIRQLLLTIALSQVFAIQGLLLVTAGALATSATADAGGIGLICSGAPFQGDRDTSPLDQTEHHDCLGACLLSRAAGEPPVIHFVFWLPARHTRSDIPQEPALSPISRAAAFLARAPPMLT